MVATAIIDHRVKGLLKGLRYISQIFENEKENEKEHEMVIGHPTDVKHVAHIGWDGGHATDDFQSAPLSTTMGPDGKEGVSPKSASQEILLLGGFPPPSPARDETAFPKQPRRVRRHASTEKAGSASPARDTSSSRGTRHSRQSTGSAPGSESPAREPSESRRGRRHHKCDNTSGSGSGSAESSDLPSIPKQKMKERRSKGSTDGGSSRSSHRSKNPHFSVPCAEEAVARSEAG